MDNFITSLLKGDQYEGYEEVNSRIRTKVRDDNYCYGCGFTLEDGKIKTINGIRNCSKCSTAYYKYLADYDEVQRLQKIFDEQYINELKIYESNVLKEKNEFMKKQRKIHHKEFRNCYKEYDEGDKTRETKRLCDQRYSKLRKELEMGFESKDYILPPSRKIVTQITKPLIYMSMLNRRRLKNHIPEIN